MGRISARLKINRLTRNRADDITLQAPAGDATLHLPFRDARWFHHLYAHRTPVIGRPTAAGLYHSWMTRPLTTSRHQLPSRPPLSSAITVSVNYDPTEFARCAHTAWRRRRFSRPHHSRARQPAAGLCHPHCLRTGRFAFALRCCAHAFGETAQCLHPTACPDW